MLQIMGKIKKISRSSRPFGPTCHLSAPHTLRNALQIMRVLNNTSSLMQSQLIRESSSPYASPIVIVRKKDCQICLCVGFRHFNIKTRKDAFPLPRIEESLDALCRAKLVLMDRSLLPEGSTSKSL